MIEKMKVEVWSDVMCPFCYIGKRKFEAAIKRFDEAEHIELEWKSFQLAPDLITDPGKGIYQHLADQKGISLEESKKMHEQVSQMATDAGLTYDFDNAVVSNSFNAHRLLHFAKEKGVQNEAEELVFKAHFTDGRDIDNKEILIALVAELGLDAGEFEKAFDEGKYANAVNADIREARQLGVNGVPFFVFDRKYAISGAQQTEVFLNTIAQSFAEWREAHPEGTFKTIEGEMCRSDGTCD